MKCDDTKTTSGEEKERDMAGEFQILNFKKFFPIKFNNKGFGV